MTNTQNIENYLIEMKNELSILNENLKIIADSIKSVSITLEKK